MSTDPTPAHASLDAATIARAWRSALALWEVSVTLSPPQPYAGTQHGKAWRSNEPLAYIDLETRQVVVNFVLLAKLKAATSLTAVLAHEIGHHVRYPHSLALAASLQVLEGRLIPGLRQSLTNLFFDLLVNEVVGRTLGDDLCRVYQGFVRQSKPIDPLFAFYLGVYEELWGLPEGTLVPLTVAKSQEEKHPGWRADARIFVSTFYSLPGIHLQFVYFCSCFIRYIEDPEKLTFVIPLGGDLPAPDADDLDAVIRGLGSDAAEDALEEARERGFLDDSGLEEREADDALTTIDRVTAHLPGKGAAAFKKVLVSRHYRRLVDQYLIPPPPADAAPEPSLPTVPEEWEWGDNPRLIDWTATLIARGALGPVQPLRRDLEPDERRPGSNAFPALEVYLDTSGSMPDPASSLNAMTLAAQVLAASALRHQGVVRGIVYSSGKPLVSPWMYDEETARQFLLSYAGGGTDFPFEVLRASARERSDVVRVIISDSDFLSNVRPKESMEALCFGADRSRLLVVFLAYPNRKGAEEVLSRALRSVRLRLVTVQSLADFAGVAAKLSDALFGGSTMPAHAGA